MVTAVSEVQVGAGIDIEQAIIGFAEQYANRVLAKFDQGKELLATEQVAFKGCAISFQIKVKDLNKITYTQFIRYLRSCHKETRFAVEDAAKLYPCQFDSTDQSDEVKIGRIVLKGMREECGLEPGSEIGLIQIAICMHNYGASSVWA